MIELKKDSITIACCSPRVYTAQPDKNADEIIALYSEADRHGADFVLFPELSVTGYTCGDLFLNYDLLNDSYNALMRIVQATKNLNAALIVGFPNPQDGRVYDAAALIKGGRILKTFCKKELCDMDGLAESRIFTPLSGENGSVCIKNGKAEYLLGVCIGDNYDDYKEDIVLILHNGKEYLGSVKETKSRLKLISLGGKTMALAGAGFGESTTDAVHSGMKIIAQSGEIKASKCARKEQMIISELKLKKSIASGAKKILGSLNEKRSGKPFSSQRPYLPDLSEEKICKRAFDLQCRALAGRLTAIGCKKAVIGVSGGLDSTLALLVAAKTFDMLGLDRKNIFGITMPCFGTTGSSKNLAVGLMKELGVTSSEINIKQAVMSHFSDIGHDESVRNTAYENAQARERTQVLMDIANDIGAIVIGTGDLSEIALGWCTYGGDHLSMYAVNSGVPKTLIRMMITQMAKGSSKSMSDRLRAIIDQPVSPELLPAQDETTGQKTEEILGDYELHDFILWYFYRGYEVEKIFRLALAAFGNKYDKTYIKKTLETFYRRFFSSQFKRSCSPDGPQILSFSLSPRGGLMMPSDTMSDIWLRKIESL